MKGLLVCIVRSLAKANKFAQRYEKLIYVVFLFLKLTIQFTASSNEVMPKLIDVTQDIIEVVVGQQQ